MMSLQEFMRRYDLDLSILSAIGSLLLGALGMYFIYRWGEVLRVSDEKTRKLLLGESIAELIDSGQALSLMISIYLIFWMEFSAAIRMNGPVKKAVEQTL